jgi:hypothetical protein
MKHELCSKEETTYYQADWGTKNKIRLVVRYGFKGNSYFSATCDEYEDGRDIGGGANHELIAEKFPHLAPYLKWHLCDWNKGPLHYIANALYWAGHSGYCDGKPNSPPNREHLLSTIVYGAVEGDELVEPSALTKEELTEWLKGRFESLMAAFAKDMIALGVAEETND